MNRNREKAYSAGNLQLRLPAEEMEEFVVVGMVRQCIAEPTAAWLRANSQRVRSQREVKAWHLIFHWTESRLCLFRRLDLSRSDNKEEKNDGDFIDRCETVR